MLIILSTTYVKILRLLKHLMCLNIKRVGSIFQIFKNLGLLKHEISSRQHFNRFLITKRPYFLGFLKNFEFTKGEKFFMKEGLLRGSMQARLSHLLIHIRLEF